MADARAPAPAGFKPGFLNDAAKKRPRDAAARPPDAKKRKEAPKEGARPERLCDPPVPRKKMIVKGPLGWDVELTPAFHMPEPRLGPVLLDPPSMLDQVTKHEWCSLDSYKHWKLHCEPGVGVEIDLIKGDSEPGDPTNVLPAEDEAFLKSLEPLMAGAERTGGSGGDAFARGKKQAKDAVWLKNTTYLSNNLHEPVHDFGTLAKERESKAREVMKAEIAVPGGSGSRAVDASFAAAAALDAATLRHPKDPSLRAEAVLPLAPDLDLWANSYVQVSVADDPDAAVRGKRDAAGQPLPLPADALISKVCATTHRRRGAHVLSASYSRPDPAAPGAYAWTRQYQLNFKEERAQDGERLVLFMDSERGVATYLQQQPKRMELDKGRATEAAREDPATPVDVDWSGSTTLVYEAAPDGKRAAGFDAAARNAWRAKMRAIDNVDVSEDEYVSASEDEESD